MQKRIIVALFIVAVLKVVCLGQTPTYTPKHFVVAYDTSEFKPIIPLKNGFCRIYHPLQSLEIWDTDDDNTTPVTGWIPALICMEGNFKDDKKNDIFRMYLIDSLDHSKRYRIGQQTYINDKLNGEWRTYFLNGTIAKIATYKDDSLHGTSRIYGINGKTIKEEITYINGSTNYAVRTYFKSGKTERESSFKNGLLNGVAKTCYENGHAKEIIHFVKGKAHGPTNRYYENGNRMEELNMADGQFHGIRKYYHPNGKLWSVEEYKNGMPWNAIANYTDKGVKRNEGTLKNGTGTLIYYDENDAVSETLKFVNGRAQ